MITNKNFCRNSIAFIFLFLGSTAISQTILCPQNKEVDQLIDKGIGYTKAGEPEKGIEVLTKAINISKSSDCRHGELSARKNLMLLYAQAYNYKKALEISEEAEKIAQQLKDYPVLSTLYTTRATLYVNLGMYSESIRQYETALTYTELIKNEDSRQYNRGFIYYNLAPYYQDTSLEKSIEYLKKSKYEIEKIKDSSTTISLSKKKDMLVSTNMNLGTFYYLKRNPKKNLRLAASYFMAALKDAENDRYEIRPDSKIDLFEALLEFYYNTKDYEKAIHYGEKMLDLEKSYHMPYNRRVCYMVLAKSYLGTGQNEISQKYLELYSKLNDSINTVEKKAVEDPVRQVIKKNEKSYSQRIKNISVIVGTLVLALLLTGLIIWKHKKKRLHRKYEAIIDHLKTNLSEPQETPAAPSQQQVPEKNMQRSVNISKETITLLLSKLDKFEKSNRFIKPEVNFAYLSNYLGTNSKYLNEILKQYKDKTFSQYINDLRIDYITQLLYEEPKYREYKISYLAEACGFSSRAIFAIAFKKKTGISPSYFIEHLRLRE
ncbi:helix-turn-helix domain-containing protein [Niabella aquatica]